MEFYNAFPFSAFENSRIDFSPNKNSSSFPHCCVETCKILELYKCTGVLSLAGNDETIADGQKVSEILMQFSREE